MLEPDQPGIDRADSLRGHYRRRESRFRHLPILHVRLFPTGTPQPAGPLHFVHRLLSTDLLAALKLPDLNSQPRAR